MSRKPPTVVWRFLVAELWRLMLLTAVVLVATLAFAAAVKPLADGILGPLDTLKFMAFAMVPMLQYALPFAAGFGATLAYHRMAADNELTACHAGGLSHRVVLIPAVISGLVLAGVLLLLSNSTIPRFLQSMEGLITEDATRLLVSKIDRGEPIDQLEGLQVYAEEAHALGPDPERGAFQEIWLGRVLVVQINDEEGENFGQIQAEGFAKEARLWLYPDHGNDPENAGRSVATRIEMRLFDVNGRRPGEGAFEQATLDYELRIPNAFKDDPKFLTWSELRRLRDEPRRMNFVDARRRTLATHLAQRQTLDHLRALFANSPNAAQFVDPLGRVVTIRASQMRWDPAIERHVLRPLTGPDSDIVVTRVDESGRIDELRASGASLRAPPETDDLEAGVRIDLLLDNVQLVRQGEDTPSGRRREWRLDDLTPTDFGVDDFVSRDSAQLLDIADAHLAVRPNDAFIENPAKDLRKRIDNLNREITSKQHERLAMASACFVMVLCGGVIALRLRDALPLQVYLWSFFPALAAVLTISTGQGMVHDHGAAGLPVLWGGVVLLSAFTLAQFYRLARH